MKPEGSLPRLQVPATCPYPEPDRSRTCPHVPLPDDASYYPPIYAWAFQVVSFPQVPPPVPCIHHSSLTYVLHAPYGFDLITRTTFGEQYRSLISFYSFLHSPVTSSLLGPNILLSNLTSKTPSLPSSSV